MGAPLPSRCRAVVVAVLTLVAVASGVLLPAAASASWATATAPRAVGITTAVVAPPTGVSAVLAQCSNSRWMSVTVSWSASTSPGVSGYTVVAHRGDGSTATVTTAAASATSAPTTLDKLSAGAATATFTVITRTSYGWTAESASSGAISC